MATPPSFSFAARVRTLMGQLDISSAVLAKKSGLSPSLISRLITDTDAARREPQMEHLLALARGLELAPAELVAGTDAERVLGQWIPREEFEKEVQARNEAQRQASERRTELAGIQAELQCTADNLEQMSREATRAAKAEMDARRDQASLRATLEAERARLGVALQERDQALQQANQNYAAWADAQNQVENIRRQLNENKSAAWICTLLGAGAGAILANAAAEPAKRRH